MLAWFTYNPDGSPLWMVMTANNTAPGIYTGSLYTSTGPAFNAVPFDPTKVSPVPAGTGTLTFTDGNNAKFDYMVQLDGIPNAVTQSKQITRQVFTAPGTMCQ